MKRLVNDSLAQSDFPNDCRPGFSRVSSYFNFPVSAMIFAQMLWCFLYSLSWAYWACLVWPFGLLSLDLQLDPAAAKLWKAAVCPCWFSEQEWTRIRRHLSITLGHPCLKWGFEKGYPDQKVNKNLLLEIYAYIFWFILWLVRFRWLSAGLHVLFSILLKCFQWCRCRIVLKGKRSLCWGIQYSLHHSSKKELKLPSSNCKTWHTSDINAFQMTILNTFI